VRETGVVTLRVVAIPRARTDLTSRRKRVVANATLRGLEIHERLTSRLLVSVTAPADDPFYRQPEDLDALRPGEVLDARPVEVRALRRSGRCSRISAPSTASGRAPIRPTR
jgi:hypothetical protein